MPEQALQVAGAILIVAAFAAVQLGWLAPRAWASLWLNLVGSVMLGVDAWRGSDWGFVLLEVVWAVVSLAGIAARLRAPAEPVRPERAVD